MSTSGIARRTLGLSVPITEVLNPTLWRERYAPNITLGPSSGGSDTAFRQSLVDLVCGKAKVSKTEASRAIDQTQDAITAAANEIPPDTIRWHLRAALSELEIKLGIPMGVTVYKSPPVDDGLVRGQHYDVIYPRKPMMEVQNSNFYRLDMPAGVISVERVRAYWWDQLVWEISAAQDNLELIHLEHPKQGSAHILPTTASNLLITAPGVSGADWGAWQMFTTAAKPVPGVWGLDFTTGPVDQYGNPGEIEVVLAHWVYSVAGILLLSIGGLAKSQGLTSASVSMDGLSRSVGLQASAIYGVNSALENALEKATQRIDWKALKTYKQGLRIIPYGR